MDRRRAEILDARGAPMTGVLITVYDHGTEDLATLYDEDDTGSTPKANPFVNDTNGFYSYYAANGNYDEVPSKAGATFDPTNFTDVKLFDPADALAGFGGPIYTDELTGLRLSNNGTDATNDLDIAAGAAASDNADVMDRVLLRLPSGLTKQLDAEWAEGTGAGGRVAGQTLEDGTWHVFLFRRDGGDEDVCFSNTLTFTLPDSGTHRRRIGSIVRATAIRPFVQRGDMFRWTSKPAADFDTTTGTNANTVTAKVPTGIIVEAFGQWRTSASARVLWTSLDETDEAPSATAVPHGQGAASAQNDTWGPLPTNTSGQVRMRSTDNVTVTSGTHGYYDRRGRG